MSASTTKNKSPQRRWPQTTDDGIRQPKRSSDLPTREQLAFELFSLRGFAFEVIVAWEHCGNTRPALEALRAVLRSPFAMDISDLVRAHIQGGIHPGAPSAAGSGDNAARPRGGSMPPRGRAFQQRSGEKF